VWLPASAGAVVLLAAAAIRRPRLLRPVLVPWQLVVFASGLFLVVEAGHALGLADALAAAVGEGDEPLDLLRLAGSAALAANLADNLPAYLALEPLATDPARLAALLVGVNAGPLITPWASLATLLWHQRLVSLGVELRWSRYVLLGCLVVPPTVVLATLAIG
jgi:arsenical pump membrane protein